MIRTAACFSLALALPAGAFELFLPVDCTLGDTCYIQNYSDHDPGPAASDFTCGPLSYDGHDGTDFALPTRAAMEAGVAVLAAAPGKVLRLRDGVPDFAAATPNQECGNGLVIDHGEGWETQYCHLKQGSLLIKPGDEVVAGTPLGQIGQSGQADFPHLHLTVRQNGRKVDPFAPDAPACGAPGEDLWADDLLTEPGGLLDIGITTAVPEFDAIKSGLASPDLSRTAPALVLWVRTFGQRSGDELLLTLSGPEGAVISEAIPLEKTQAMAFRAIGRKLKTEGWPPGIYTGTASLLRFGQELDRLQISVTVTP
ncbi:MAG: M23 family metallopeptidase [Tabrizicola sp.]|nr:M23 family metallopeptidase [Tabrizicola sp.]